ncbi:MAG: hypothetical protein ACRD1Y_04780 [Terriglobales bacterium]
MEQGSILHEALELEDEFDRRVRQEKPVAARWGAGWAAALVLLLGLAVFAGPRAAAQGNTQAAHLALQLTDEMAHGQYPAVYAALDPGLRQSLTQDSLGQLWKNIVLANGNFQFAAPASEKNANGALSEYVKCVFSQSSVYLVWTFDSAGLTVSAIQVAATD